MKWFVKESIRPSDPATARANKSIAGAGAILVVALLVGWYLLKPEWQEYLVAEAARDKISAQHEVVGSYQEKLAALSQNLASHQINTSQLERILPSRVQPATLYYLVEQIAAQAGLTAVSVSVDLGGAIEQGSAAANGSGPQEPFSGNHGLYTIAITVRGNGTTEQLQGMLRLLEGAPRLFEVTSLDMTVAPSSLLSFDMGLNAYAYAPVKTPEQGDGAATGAE